MEDQPTGTVARAVIVLRSIAEAEGPVTIAGLAGSLELPRPTVHRLLNLLRAQGMVEVDATTKTYTIGQDFFRIAALVMKRRSLTGIARPFMERIVEECGETCLLGIYLPAQRMMNFTEEVRSAHPLGYRIDKLTPMSVVWGASGRAILAFLPPEEIDLVLREKRGPSVTGQKPPPRAKMLEVLAKIRADGYAYSEGDKTPDSRGIAAPVLDSSGQALGSLCLTIPELRFRPGSREELGELLRRNASELSAVLGYEKS